MVTITIHGERRQVEQGTTYEAIAAEDQKEYDGTIALVSANGKIRELFKKVIKDCTIEFFTLKDSVGHKSYIRAAKMLFLKSMSDVFGAPAARDSCVEFSIGRGLYINTLGRVAATGENAVIVNSTKADVIIGPIGIVIADSMLGEITSDMANAVARSNAKRILIPVSHCDNIVAGVGDLNTGKLIQAAVCELLRL